MRFSVVIVNWKSGPNLARLLRSLAPVSDAFGSVIVVDNAQGEEKGEAVEAFGDARSPLRWLQMSANRGFAGGANAGIEETDGDWVLLLNPDIEVMQDSIRGLIRTACARPQAAILCGPLVSRDGSSQSDFQLRPLPTWSSVLSDALFLDEWRQLLRPSSLRGKQPAAPSTPCLVEQPAAAYWLLRRSAWKSIGGFDADFYPAWFEDVDFCKRLRQADWSILYLPDCPAWHQGGYSVDRLGRRRFLSIYYRNQLRYLRKHHPFAHLWLRWPVLAGMWIRMAAARG